MLFLVWKTIENIFIFHKILTGVMLEKDPKQHKNRTRKTANVTERAGNT